MWRISDYDNPDADPVLLGQTNVGIGIEAIDIEPRNDQYAYAVGGDSKKLFIA